MGSVVSGSVRIQAREFEMANNSLIFFGHSLSNAWSKAEQVGINKIGGVALRVILKFAVGFAYLVSVVTSPVKGMVVAIARRRAKSDITKKLFLQRGVEFARAGMGDALSMKKLRESALRYVASIAREENNDPVRIAAVLTRDKADATINHRIANFDFVRGPDRINDRTSALKVAFNVAGEIAYSQFLLLPVVDSVVASINENILDVNEGVDLDSVRNLVVDVLLPFAKIGSSEMTVDEVKHEIFSRVSEKINHQELCAKRDTLQSQKSGPAFELLKNAFEATSSARITELEEELGKGNSRLFYFIGPKVANDTGYRSTLDRRQEELKVVEQKYTKLAQTIPPHTLEDHANTDAFARISEELETLLALKEERDSLKEIIDQTEELIAVREEELSQLVEYSKSSKKTILGLIEGKVQLLDSILNARSIFPSRNQTNTNTATQLRNFI